MKKVLFFFCVILFMAVPANAMDFTPPDAPSSAQAYMPDETESFGEGLLFVLRAAIPVIMPSIAQASGICLSLICVSLLIGLLSECFPQTKSVVELGGVIISGILLFQPANVLVQMGTETIQQISQYGKLLLPVMTAALAAQGGITKSASVYAATAFFDTILSQAISELLVPLVYIFLCIAMVSHLFGQTLLADLQKFLKWLIHWGLKTILYLFTGYITVTGVVSGTTDAMTLKATKLTISGMIPMVGNILSDASEAVLVSAGIMKNAVGIYGLLALIAIGIGPFLQIGIQYLLLKVTAGISDMLGTKKIAGIIKEFSITMGLVLAMTGAVCLIFLISTISFMKGVS